MTYAEGASVILPIRCVVGPADIAPLAVHITSGHPRARRTTSTAASSSSHDKRATPTEVEARRERSS